jgi:SulP family sulfate permease
VVADEPSTLYTLSGDRLRDMESEAPELAAAFHRFIANVLAERLVGLNETIRALLK